MNHFKVWRIIERYPEHEFSIGASVGIRRAIGQALVVFFEKLAQLPMPETENEQSPRT